MKLILIAIIVAPGAFSLVTKLDNLGKCRRCRRWKDCPARRNIDSRDCTEYYHSVYD